ncbi:MAG: amino acid adenylation domain-containing protein, partial [candidate division KSB1 bacterium]|nr:amino acid adenylation domain-containing protein [candidate division KSB1 bacterium]
DGWSVGVLIREISVLYNAFVKGEPDPLPELPIQYADFAVWQQQYLSGEVLERQLSYWKHQLNGRYGKLQVLELPTDRPRPAIQTSNGDNVDAVLPGQLIHRLKALSSQEGTTLFMTLLAAFKVLLHRYTGQEDISVGSPIANRTRAEIESLIGFFVNTLVLRTDLSGDPSFRELLQRVKEVTLGAYANQDIPFERLVELVQPERDMSHSPLFQVMFILQNNPMNGGVELPNVHLSTLDINAGTSTFDLTLMVTEQSYGANISIEYNTDLFDASTMRRLIDHYQQLLEGIVANPNEKISRLPLLTGSERQQVVVEWNKNEADYPRGLCIHQLFEAQAESTPDAIAVAFDGQYLTYRELDQRANQLAHYLRKHGVGPEKLVGICADKSLDLIVGVIGTIKAGGAYVPIDPTYPPDRIDHMLKDSNVTVLLTQHSLVPNLPDYDGEIICLDTDWVKIARQPIDKPMVHVTPENLVYVIYTSGSTGKSKGVMVMHKTLVNQYHAWEETFRLRTDATSHLQMASFSFDVFSGDLVRALCSGGKLVLVPRDLLLEADKLYQLMLKEQVDIAEFVPAVLRNLVQYLDTTGQDLKFMKVLIAGSDVWYVGEYKKFLKYCSPSTRLLNTFGLTEATIDSSYFESKDLNLSLERLVPIGIPFNNTKIYIVDELIQPLPIGIPGELCVGGAGLARGYLNRPDLTAEKFIPNPFSQVPGDRLYRTGDRARFLADGNIEFLGRIDNQVKIRGYRIELGEIESALEKHPSVKDVVVSAREDAPGSKRLVAYIVTKNGVQPTVGEFHSFLKEQLPEYMVPSYFMFLEKMPLTPNGKIDRRALPAPDQQSAAVLATEYVAPRTPVEQKLAQIWTQLLGIEKIGVNDNFFELGGHSLLATQLVSRIRAEFHIELPLRTVFEVPFIAELAKKIDIALVSERAFEAPPIVPVPREQELPLSFAQQRLWFLDQLEPNSPFYNIPEAVRLRGHLDVEALEQSLNEVVRRHESLRTTFHSHRGKPYQVIHPNMIIPLRKVDLRSVPLDDRELELQAIAKQEAQRPFDLTIGPLLRATLVQLDVDDHVVFYTMHHIIGDDWSSAVLVREITLCYDAFTHNRPSPLPELPIQYADFAYWQQQWLQGEVLEAQLNYWKQQLSGAPARLELPTDRPRPPVQTFNGAYKTFEFSEELSQAIKDLGNKEGTTLFMTLLAAFQTLLYRYSGQQDILVGSPIANRTNGQLENLIGFFVNTLVFRTDLSGNPNFRELLHRVREVALGAYAHQDLPFEKLVDALQPQRDLSHSPLFQVMFVIQNVPRQASTISGLSVIPIENHSGTSKFDMTLFMLEEGNKLAGALEYNTDLFDEATIVRMLQHFENLLKQMVSQPELRIDEISLLSPEERHRAITVWNDTDVAYPAHRFVHRLFEAQVERTPHAPAVVFGTEQMTYLELNQAANQLAHFLQKMGIGPERMVAIFMERSLEVMVALLGVLKAGGAYLPIDPSYPKERVAFMLEDANATVVLTQERLVANLPAQSTKMMEPQAGRPPVIICLDFEWRRIASESDQNLSVELDDDHLAYVIYTSGSTGKPKGTLITHRGFMNYLFWCLENYPLKQGRGSLVHSSLAFDATITGLYAPLLVGRAVYLVPESKDIEIVAQSLRQYRNFSIVKITPAHLQLLGNQLPAEEAADLVHAFIIGGENLTSDHIAFWLQYAPNTKLINEYGPTETVVGCMNYDTPHDFRKRGSVPIGFPIANMKVYLLDQNLEPVPIGVPGEMYIGGVAVARGYLNRPDLTAEKFIPDPFSGKPGARLYRTGDLAKYLPDGNIEFLGRIDHQVKIRGFRIELGEIQATLGKHPGIKENVVIDWRVDGDTRLVAYYVPGQEPAPSMDELRAFLEEQLPEYMIPAAFMKIDSIPLTSNAKVDRKALPAPHLSRSDIKKEFVAPRTRTESELAKLWTELIKIDRVGIYDSFFELGGHSLLATQLLARVREQFKVDLPLITIFEAPTLSAMAERIDRAFVEQGFTDSTPIQPVPRDGSTDLVLSFSQQRLWFLDQLDPGQSFYNIPSSVRLQGNLNLLALKNAIAEVMRRHEILRTSFVEKKGKPIMVIDQQAQVQLPIVDLTELPLWQREQEVKRLANESARLPFDLAHGPLFRTTLLKLNVEDHVVLFTMHHIISDGWSVNILMREMAALYEAFVQGRPSPLPELPIQFADYAHWQRSYLTGEVLERQLLYWKKKLANAPALLELPTDRPRPAMKTFNGSLRAFEINRELAERIEHLGQQHGATLFMTLLAAFQTLLYRYSGQSDISIGTPIANRTRKEVEALIGFFANTLVLRTDLSGDPSFVELFRRVRGVCLGAYQNQDVPFEKLVEQIQPERNLSHTPLFQVMFILQNNPRSAIQSSGLQMIPIMSEIGTTQFDLTLSLEPGPDGIAGVLEFNTDLFNGETIDQMVRHFMNLLNQMVTNPEQSISKVPLLSQQEYERYIYDWNATAAPYPDRQCVHKLFEAQVERTPEAIALAFENQQLTYRQLNQRANQLAHFLQKMGVGPEVVVGISVDRSIEMVVGLLGIMKAGGAYLPIDPAYPSERIVYMLADAELKVLLTQQKLLPRLPLNGTKAICLDRDWDLIAAEDDSNPISGATIDNLAYMIYTSGSTGKPKGVMLPHRGLCNLTHSQIQDFSVTCDSRVLQFASFSFDASVSEIFMALLTGATLYLASRDTLLSTPDLIELFQRERITTVTLPPSLLKVLPTEGLDHLTTIISAGEACTKDIALRWSKGRRLLNAYGPTETTIGVTSYLVEQIPDECTTIPIGRPIQNMQLYILDQHLNPVPRGVRGELFIGGIGVGRGYHHRPDLTAEKFIPDPFSKTPGARLYRTGDLARFLSDGNIEFLGRIDHQVKVRGFRIELGEIESALLDHPLILDAAVVAKPIRPNSPDHRLIAYFVPKSQEPLSTSDLIEFLKTKLP